MNANRKDLVFLIPFWLMMVSLACSLPSQSETAAPEPTLAPTETLQQELTAPASPTDSAPPEDTQTATEAPPEPEVTEAPTATPEAYPTVASGVLKEQLFYGGMGGGGEEGVLCEDHIPEPGSELPIIIPEGRSDFMGMLETQTFCIFGFPFDEDTNMALYSSDGVLIGEGILHVNSAEIENGVRRFDETIGDWVWIGEAEIVEGIPTVRLYLWVPLGLPYGEWNLSFESQSMSFGGSFENTPPDGITISILPEGEFNMFPEFGCEHVGLDETVYIYGHGFEAQAAIPIGVYVDADWGDTVLVDSLLVPTGEEGEFAAWVKIKDFYPEGYYHIIPNEAVVDDFIQYIDATGCLIVEGTSGVLEPRVPLVGPWEACPGTYWSNLRVDDYAMVSDDPPLPNRVRQTPNKQGEILGQIPPGEGLFILDGPECANGWVWWYVSAENQDLVGWTAEGNEFETWLVLVK
jgi:hypothetical protein